MRRFFRRTKKAAPVAHTQIAERIAELEAERDKALYAYNAAIGELKRLIEPAAA